MQHKEHSQKHLRFRMSGCTSSPGPRFQILADTKYILKNLSLVLGVIQNPKAKPKKQTKQQKQTTNIFQRNSLCHKNKLYSEGASSKGWSTCTACLRPWIQTQVPHNLPSTKSLVLFLELVYCRVWPYSNSAREVPTQFYLSIYLVRGPHLVALRGYL